MSKYLTEKENLNKVIEIAISVIQEYPPKGFSKENLDHLINTYLDFRNSVLNPLPNFDNSKSLSFIKNDVFTYFQEGAGITVNHFWKKIESNNLPFKRENKLKKILSRNKIKNENEYQFIIDVFQPYIESGMLNQLEIDSLNEMIRRYEGK